MGFLSRLRLATKQFGKIVRSTDSSIDDMLWAETLWSVRSEAGVSVNQQTALNATPVLAAVTMLSEDFAKLTPSVFRKGPAGQRIEAQDHELYPLLYEPNDYQNWYEFAEMEQVSLILRGNAYAVAIRGAKGEIKKLIPVNADWVALWEAPDGQIFYRVTPNGLHMMAELAGQPWLIPAEDMFHVRGFSMNGLLGASRIALAKEAIGTALGLEQQQARWLGQGTSLSGVLQTDSKLTPEAAKRMAQDWKDAKGGIQNSGKIAVLEQGLKYNAIGMTAEQAQFILSRGFQLAEVARTFRIPPHMLADLTRATNNNIEQLAQEYVNFTISGYAERWKWKISTFFGLREDGLFIDFDLGVLTRANQTARYANYARGISAGFMTQNEARIDDGKDPKEGGDVLLTPTNLAAAGSQSTASGADGGGRPNEGEEGLPRHLNGHGRPVPYANGHGEQ